MYRLKIALATISATAMLSACADQHQDERASAWSTTTRLEVLPTPALAPPMAQHREQAFAATKIRTASLAPVAPALPKSSLSGSHQLNGIASFYWQEQKTATGEQFDKTAMTAAHKTLPFGTRVKVTNQSNGRSVVVRINDRGPFKPGRVIDLSLAAADVVGMRDRGLAPVSLEIVN